MGRHQLLVRTKFKNHLVVTGRVSTPPPPPLGGKGVRGAKLAVKVQRTGGGLVAVDGPSPGLICVVVRSPTPQPPPQARGRYQGPGGGPSPLEHGER